MHTSAVLIELSWLSKKPEQKLGREMCWKDMGELEEGTGGRCVYSIVCLYGILKNKDRLTKIGELER